MAIFHISKSPQFSKRLQSTMPSTRANPTMPFTHSNVVCAALNGSQHLLTEDDAGCVCLLPNVHVLYCVALLLLSVCVLYMFSE